MLAVLAQAACTEADEHGADGSTAEQRGWEFIPDPVAALQVVFRWENAARGQEGFFVWRQGDDIRRWDLVTIRTGKPVTGSFSIDADFSRDLSFGHQRLGCMWLTVDSPPDHVMVGCGSGGRPVFKPVDDALTAVINERLRERTISGRNASCYSFQHPQYSLGAFCVDLSEGIPLLFTTESLLDSLFSQPVEAIAVSTAKQSLVIPFGLEANPREGFPDFDDTVPVSELLLPDLSDFLE